jgi:hypothetical protein
MYGYGGLPLYDRSKERMILDRGLEPMYELFVDWYFTWAPHCPS